MELKLAEGEQIAKSWDYAISGGLFKKDAKKIHSNLTITNKRVIATDYNDIYLNRDEIPVSSIISVGGSCKRRRKFWSMVKLVIGIPLCLLIVGIFMVKRALEEMKAASFNLKLITARSKFVEEFHVGAFNAGPAKKENIFTKLFGRFKKTKAVKINVKSDIAREVLDEIGAVILNQQN